MTKSIAGRAVAASALAIAFTWLYSDSFCTRLLRARVAVSLSWLSRDSTMFCLSSSDIAFCLSR